MSDLKNLESLESLRISLRERFPTINSSTPAFMDNAGGSLVPQRVVTAVANILERRGSSNSNQSHLFGKGQLSLKRFAHEVTGLFFNAPNGAADVALGPSSTALAFRLSAAFAKVWGKGDAVIISDLEHECNASPWRALEQCGVEIRMWRCRWPEAHLDLRDLADLMADGRVRLVAMTAASNVLGVLTEYVEATKIVHARGAMICVDWVHLAVHHLPNVARDDVDVMLFSPYKVFAPHLGCMYIRSSLIPRLNPPTLSFYDPRSIARFELGTPAFESLAGWVGSLQYIAYDVGGAEEGSKLTRASLEQGYRRIAELEAPVSAKLISGLSNIPGVVVYGDLKHRVGTASFTVAGRKSPEVARALCERGIFVNSGHFHATMPVEALGLMPDGVVRASIVHYNSESEVATLIESVRSIALASKI